MGGLQASAMGVWVNDDPYLPCRECRRNKSKKGGIVRGVLDGLQWDKNLQMEMTSSLHFNMGTGLRRD